VRSSVSVKVVSVLAIVLALGAIGLFAVYDGLSRVGREMRQLAEIREPSYSATNKIEINLNGMAHAVFAYLRNPQPQHRTKMEEDEADVAAYLERYLALAATDAERSLGRQLGVMFREFRSLGDSLVRQRERQEVALTTVAENLERADLAIDRVLHLTPNTAGTAAKLAALSDLESELAEVAFGLANYQRARDPRFKNSIALNAEEFRATLRRLTSLSLTSPDSGQVRAIERRFQRTMTGVGEVLAVEDDLSRESTRFLELSAAMDDLLDEQIQPLALELLYQPRRAAGQVTGNVLQRARWLIPAVLAVVAIVAAILIRSVLGPLRRLKAGTEAVGRGDLGHRIAVTGDDEFGDVAAEFNRMVERLEATTVSKQALERSERRLRRTVRRLRREIGERIQAEAERARLEASLRRAETMSAMGALVAGVAHEVRNPLFGVLSVLDAMEVRLGDQVELRRYLPVLRDEAGRLTRLMQELMEYGKPPSNELSPGSIAGVLAQALQHCEGLAAERGVRLVLRASAELPPVRLDRDRLIRVFRNLLENAIQHSEPDDEVLLAGQELQADGSVWVECSVTDSGPGFRSEDLPHVFEPFFTRRRGGTGLGLSIVHQIAHEHRGEIVAENRPEGGAVLTVRLPAFEGPAEDATGDGGFEPGASRRAEAWR
jgi:signal transduction histidine kinase